MFRLIEADFTSAGKLHLRNGSPSSLLDFGTRNMLLRERSHFGLQIVTHEVKFVNTILLGRVECSFGGRQGED